MFSASLTMLARVRALARRNAVGRSMGKMLVLASAAGERGGCSAAAEEAARTPKHQAPSTNTQRNTKLQDPTPRHKIRFLPPRTKALRARLARFETWMFC